MPELTTNFAVSTVATPPSPSTSGTSLVVAAGEGSRFPTAPFNATIAPDGVQATPANAEVVRVTARSTDTLTITRAQEGSSARAVVAGDRIWAGVTKKTLSDMESRFEARLIAATSVGATSVTLDRPQDVFTTAMGYVAIGVGTATCELRKVSTVSGASVTVTALANTHAADSRVQFFQGDSVPTTWFGMRNDALTALPDDEPALQWAVRETVRYQLWLDGMQADYVIAKPLILPSNTRMRSFGAIYQHPTLYGPKDLTNAMVCNQNGQILPFTASASTDTFTTTGNHNIGGNARVRVMFKGSSLPTGITAGKLYWAVNSAGATTFQVSLQESGSAVNFTTDGSGTVYVNMYGLGRVYFDDVLVYGGDVAGTNGMILTLQQPAEIKKLRVDHCPGFGLNLSGQQAVFHNFESVACGEALQLDSASFMWFYGFNAEQCSKALHVMPSRSIGPNEFRVASDLGGAHNCLWSGAHIEMTTGTNVPWDIDGNYTQLEWDNVYMTTNGPNFWWFHNEATPNSYSIRHVQSTSGNATPGTAVVFDETRGITYDLYDTGRTITRIEAPGDPQSTSPAAPTIWVLGKDGRYLKYGSYNDVAPTLDLKPGAAQTAEQTVWRNTGGTAMLGVIPSGALELTEQSDPAAPGANKGRLYVKDNGSGKSQLVVRFPSGAVQVISTEP